MLSLGPRRDLDPRAYAFAERVVAFRRMWHKQPQRQSIIRDIWRAYCIQGHPGCKGEEVPQRSEGDGGLFSGEQDQRGPIGLLLHMLALLGMPADGGWK
eukprot:9453120-Alexandrium_andersonii.AAC.1